MTQSIPQDFCKHVAAICWALCIWSWPGDELPAWAKGYAPKRDWQFIEEERYLRYRDGPPYGMYFPPEVRLKAALVGGRPRRKGAHPYKVIYHPGEAGPALVVPRLLAHAPACFFSRQPMVAHQRGWTT